MSSSNISYGIPPAYASAALHVCYHSVASLTFLIWDLIVMLDDEVQYIWAMRNKNPFKWVYFFIRYVVILAYVTHNVLAEALTNGSNPPVLCKIWYTYIIVLTQIIQTLLELILASRVFALYNRSRKVAFLLLTLILMEIAGAVRMLSLDRVPAFYGTCLLLMADKDGLKQSILGFVVHCALIGLTLFKYLIARRAGWGRTPLVSLVVRDNTTVYVTIIFLLVSVVFLCGLENERWVTIFYWATSLTSISACRMILSMERFARKQALAESSPDHALFTSKFSLGTFDSGSRHDRSTP